MKKIITKIRSLFATKKAKIIAGTLAIAIVAGGIFAVANTASADSAWAVLLTFFGKANVSGNVWQSVLLDGGRYNDGDDTRIQVFTTSDIFAGETTISIHDLENRSSVEQNVALVTSYFPINIAGVIDTSYYGLKRLEDTRNIEKIWGGNSDTAELNGQLEVSVGYEGSEEDSKNSYVVFKATPPSDYTAGTSLMTFTFDTNVNGWADFQVQYSGNGVWEYSEIDMVEKKWVKDVDGWQPVPEYLITSKDGREFTLKVPVEILGGFGSTYKFGVQTNGEPSHQTFYSTDPAHLWYLSSANDYIHSTYYVPMELGTEIVENTSFTIEPNETMDFAMSNKTANNLVCEGCTVTVTVEPK